MILDNICDKRKEQLERDISKVSRQDINSYGSRKRVSDSFLFKIYQA